MSANASCVDHAGVAASGPCRRCGSFLCADCLVGGHCAACVSRAAPPEPRAFGGWLILSLLTLFSLPLRFLATALKSGVELRKVDDIPASFALDPSWYVWTALGLVTDAILVGLALFALIAFLRKQKATIVRMQLFYVGVFCVNVLMTIGEAVERTASDPPVNMFGTVWPLVLPVLWINYFRTSARVKQTFLR
ncbi:MAG: DUF2569 family protein [Archangium sp.]|nr:DUF2569 family protein [Archangium sp.]